MKRNLRFGPYWVLASLVLLASCQLEKLQDPIVIPNNIEKEFYIDLQEYLHPTNRQLRFTIRTIKDQECMNETVETDYVSAGREVSLSINSIVPAVDCQEGMAPAKSEQLAGQLQAGAYNFDVALRNTVVNKGKLIVNADNYSISMETQEGIIFLHNNLQKIPNNTFWGYVVCDESEWESLQAALTNQLSGLAIIPDYRSGYYGHFEINNSTLGSRKVFLADPPTADFHFPILYQLNETADENRLKTLLDDFRANHTAITLKGFNTDGRLF